MLLESVYNFSDISAEDKAKSLDVINDLVAKAKAGETKALSQIYILTFDRIFKFVYYRVSHKEVAEDLTEDIFIKAFASLSSLSNDVSFTAWLYQIARNLIIDHYRSRKTTVDLEDVENTLEYDANIVDDANLQSQQRQFMKVLPELTPEQQIVIKLKFLEELENGEIAEMLHKNEGAIRVIQHRAIARLKELLDEVS